MLRGQTPAVVTGKTPEELAFITVVPKRRFKEMFRRKDLCSSCSVCIQAADENNNNLF